MLKLLMPVGEIPIGSTITKRTGEKRYRVQDKIEVYGDSALAKELKSSDGTRFLFPLEMSPQICVVSWDTEVIWHVKPTELQGWLYRVIEGPQQ